MVAGFVVAAGLLVLGAPAEGRVAANLTLDVTFSSSQTVSLTLPDGAPVGSTSGAPTVIPAGYYTVVITGPMGLPAGLPYFHLTGPGVDLLSNLNEGGLESATISATLLPSSTYVWTNDAVPGVVHTLTTSASVQGTPPGTAVSPVVGAPAESQDIVGSGVVALSGTLTGTVSATGKLSLVFKGKPAARLEAGRYRLVVSDHSTTSGFVLARGGDVPIPLTGAKYVGRQSTALDLAAGDWTLSGRPAGRAASTIVVG